MYADERGSGQNHLGSSERSPEREAALLFHAVKIFEFGF